MNPVNNEAVGTADAGPADDERANCQYVTFTIGEEAFAVDMMPVQEIIRLPEVVRVPLAPGALIGLANLRGKVLPIVSLRRIFGLPENEADEATRAVVVNVGQPVGLVVDRVASVVDVDPARIESAASIRSTVESDLVSGVIKDIGKHAVTMVLDCVSLIAREFAELDAAAASGGVGAAIASAIAANDEDDGDERQLVSFEVNGQEYAVTIQDVQEIVQIPETIVQVPRAAAHVLGVMNLRGRLLPLVNLRHLFGMAHRPLDDKSRIVVLTLGAAAVGITVDAVSEVLRVPSAALEPMPALLARDGELADITEICRLDGGKRLVSIIAAHQLFNQPDIIDALDAVGTLEREESPAEEGTMTIDDDEQVVLFRLGNDEFGVPIESVQEIVRVPEELVRVPKTPEFVEGVINLRGSVLPVIDLRTRLGLERIERSDRQRIVVFLIDGVRTGFIVDQVAEVLKLPKASIESAPRLSAAQGSLLSRMANLERQQRMVQLIDPGYLLDGISLDGVNGMAAMSAAA